MTGTQFWRMGASPVPATEIGRLARAFEDAGWDGLALGEAHGILPDPYVVLGVAAGATSDLKLGTSVAVPLRHPLLAADAMATVQAFSGGRARFVIGRGDGAMKVLQRGPMPVAEFEDYLRALQGFLLREDVEMNGEVSSMSRLDDIDPSLAVAATATSTLQLGTSVAVPLRHPLLAADAMATVQAFSGGRARFVIGRGDGAMKVLQRGPMPVAEFEDYLRAVQGFLLREDVEMNGEVSSMSRLDDIDPSLAVAKPEVSVAATGPRMIEVAARWADGIDFSVGADVERLRRSIALAREACERAGRDPALLRLGCYLQIAVTSDDEAASAQAREAVRGLIVTHARFSGNFSSKAAALMEPVLSATRGGVTRTAGGRPGELDFYPKEALEDERIDSFGIVAPADECVERLLEICDLGLANVYIGTRSVGVDLDEENTLRIGREVLARVR